MNAERLNNISGHLQGFGKVSPALTSMSKGPPLTTHILDTSSGRPAANVPIILYKMCPGSGQWNQVVACKTNADGRAGFLTQDMFTSDNYKLKFETETYFNSKGQETFYPFVEVVFRIKEPSQHYHVPLLLSPFGYSTYRGS